MANQTIRTTETRVKFLDALRDGASVAKAAKAAGVARSSVYEWREDDPEFADAWDDAVEEGTDLLEDEAHRRAYEGLLQFKFTKTGDAILHPITRVPYYERQYSDGLLTLLLKTRRPEKYRERVDVSGTMRTKNVPADLSQLSDEDLTNLERLLEKTDSNAGPNPRGKMPPASG